MPPSSTPSSGRWARASSCAPPTAGSSWPTRPPSAVPRRRRGDLRRHPRRARRPGRRRARARAAGGPVELARRGRTGALDRDRHLAGRRRRRAWRRPATRRSSSSATSPRRASARPSARRSSASCRTSCERRSRRSSPAPRSWRASRRRSTRTPGARSSATSTTRPSGSSGWSRTSSRSPDSARRPARSAGSRSSSSASCRASSQSEEGRWPGVTFELDIAPGLPTVIADPTYVEQVVRNLLSNAAKYGGAGSRRSRSRSKRATARSSSGSSTTGRASRPTRRTRLFELFYRSPGTAASATGAGIGLFVCARLDRRDGRPDLGRAAAEAAGPSSGSPCRSSSD